MTSDLRDLRAALRMIKDLLCAAVADANAELLAKVRR